MKFSVITVCFNSEATIRDALLSVSNQKLVDFEHVIIDGASTDSTLSIIEHSASSCSVLLSEKDAGIYDAMNKGFYSSSGDIICFLNSDDFYADEYVLSDVLALFRQGYDYVYGDIDMIDSDHQVRRRWNVGLKPTDLSCRLQIPHPAFFVRKKYLNFLPQPFDDNLKISADLKQQFQLSLLDLSGAYCARPLVNMRLGGASTSSFSNIFVGWREVVFSYNSVFGNGGVLYLFRKVFSKIPQFFNLSFKLFM